MSMDKLEKLTIKDPYSKNTFSEWEDLFKSRNYYLERYLVKENKLFGIIDMDSNEIQEFLAFLNTKRDIWLKTPFYELLGEYYLEKGESEKTYKLFYKKYKNDPPTRPESRLLLMIKLLVFSLKNNQYETSSYHFREIIAQFPPYQKHNLKKYHKLYLMIANVCFDYNMIDHAIQIYQEIIKLFPFTVEIYAQLVRLYKHKGETKKVKFAEELLHILKPDEYIVPKIKRPEKIKKVDDNKIIQYLHPLEREMKGLWNILRPFFLKNDIEETSFSGIRDLDSGNIIIKFVEEICDALSLTPPEIKIAPGALPQPLYFIYNHGKSSYKLIVQKDIIDYIPPENLRAMIINQLIHLKLEHIPFQKHPVSQLAEFLQEVFQTIVFMKIKNISITQLPSKKIVSMIRNLEKFKKIDENVLYDNFMEVFPAVLEYMTAKKIESDKTFFEKTNIEEFITAFEYSSDKLSLHVLGNIEDVISNIIIEEDAFFALKSVLKIGLSNYLEQTLFNKNIFNSKERIIQLLLLIFTN